MVSFDFRRFPSANDIWPHISFSIHILFLFISNIQPMYVCVCVCLLLNLLRKCMQLPEYVTILQITRIVLCRWLRRTPTKYSTSILAFDFDRSDATSKSWSMLVEYSFEIERKGRVKGREMKGNRKYICFNTIEMVVCRMVGKVWMCTTHPLVRDQYRASAYCIHCIATSYTINA